MTRVYLALGSNLAEPLNQVQAALRALDRLPHTQRSATSSFYRTPPYGPPDQPDFLNAVVALDTTLTPLALLEHTQHIEQQQGRERKAERWGPRTLDLDLLLFGNLQLNTPRLTLPHYDMHNRAFMLLPLIEIAPEITLPDGTKATELLARLDASTIRYW
ncbi:2-amino-4-hydroxy-6-hydroxymethyldihydropteridine diphosphokinase [Erwinia sp. OLTSP20]|uniref:2-amino-4-hydroxy-6- hydroxymethyldihydropteridine diphosphokinase n=1 Tax=unclassified Erwinia TaxID=2622719 RepID=UPI000C1A1C33|nr:MULTISPECIES: 2-amino-4-hydroxy-6-hydroxymethyldihydropteridine diphosphokinase [unclassified Erwinia]PIJ49793.1 2-amino-4-hydroxy-6-hydroxymethyldihydropteridine diphosphokinase [Erwinia sp. OAMSP11]PIJ70893.1 2-amino-4-hydroxy-6-hydroxymethyldihydropteridine diphosphokinase [Erwinia sp. OLSSP12]PIJ80258.1 2-amino-4-hydroxy-6-hydroxymethyldihydropteridine diphosphokinase [Erwinia sp. OLCASP19]PIJ82382.1 2-amino-4-hydroxy-6-hydroxymethyldihydropteridine diphosphokinase [Erwinia sp. OLMTSP26]